MALLKEAPLSAALRANQAITARTIFRPLARLANQASLPQKKKPKHVHLAELEHTPHQTALPLAPFVLQVRIKMKITVPNANCVLVAKHWSQPQRRTTTMHYPIAKIVGFFNTVPLKAMPIHVTRV
jgi:hypothetical protein